MGARWGEAVPCTCVRGACVRCVEHCVRGALCACAGGQGGRGGRWPVHATAWRVGVVGAVAQDGRPIWLLALALCSSGCCMALYGRVQRRMPWPLDTLRVACVRPPRLAPHTWHRLSSPDDPTSLAAVLAVSSPFVLLAGCHHARYRCAAPLLPFLLCGWSSPT